MKIGLTKKGNNGKQLIWETEITGSTYETTFGQIGGKLQVELTEVTEGKNIGKTNYSSPEDQAIQIVVKKALGKIVKGYHITEGQDILDQYTGKEVKAVFLEVPEPMLAQDGVKRLKYILAQKSVIIQDKLDGFRGISDGQEIYSRTRKSFTGKVPHLIPYIEEVRKQLDAPWVDGELFSDEISFNQIQSIMLKKPSTMTAEDIENAKTIKFNLFDYMSHEHQIVRTKKLGKIKANKYVNVVNSEILTDITEERIQEMHNAAVERGAEGIMIRFPNSSYEYKRSSSLLKWKVFRDLEAKIIGVTTEKNDKTKLGAMIMDLNGLTFQARPAMTDIEKAEIFANQEKYIGQMGVIKFQDFDAVTGAPRFGVFKGVRAKLDISK